MSKGKTVSVASSRVTWRLYVQSGPDWTEAEDAVTLGNATETEVIAAFKPSTPVRKPQTS